LAFEQRVAAGVAAAVEIDAKGNIVEATPPNAENTATAAVSAASAATAVVAPQEMARSEDAVVQSEALSSVDEAVGTAKKEVQRWIANFMERRAQNLSASGGAAGSVARGAGSTRGAVSQAQDDLQVSLRTEIHVDC
jgi:hypothetical protein